MGPRSDERGNNHVIFITLHHRLASMGPRSDERGNFGKEYLTGHEEKSLQWGRAPMSAEMV